MSNTLKTAMLLGVLSALLLLIGEALGGAQGLVLGFMFAALTNFASYWFSDKIVLRMYSAREAEPDSRLVRIVTQLAQKAGLPQPRCYVIPEQSPNAFATGRNAEHAAVAATEGILQLRRKFDDRMSILSSRTATGALTTRFAPSRWPAATARRFPSYSFRRLQRFMIQSGRPGPGLSIS